MKDHGCSRFPKLCWEIWEVGRTSPKLCASQPPAVRGSLVNGHPQSPAPPPAEGRFSQNSSLSSDRSRVACTPRSLLQTSRFNSKCNVPLQPPGSRDFPAVPCHPRVPAQRTGRRAGRSTARGAPGPPRAPRPQPARRRACREIGRLRHFLILTTVDNEQAGRHFLAVLRSQGSRGIRGNCACAGPGCCMCLRCLGDSAVLLAMCLRVCCAAVAAGPAGPTPVHALAPGQEEVVRPRVVEEVARVRVPDDVVRVELRTQG